MKPKLTLLFAFFVNLHVIQAQWSLTGNAGTTPPTNFLGTTDANKLIFKVNNVLAGSIDYSNSFGNTGFGFSTLISNTGIFNTAHGYNALSNAVSGNFNTACGGYSLSGNTTGTGNTAMGAETLSISSTGSDNTAIGYASQGNNTGAFNTSNGAFASYHNSTGSNNVSMGYQALFSNTTVGNLTAVGYQALYGNTSGGGNSAFGYQALLSNSTGNFNAADGYQALNLNTIGSQNTAQGYQALFINTSGSDNTAVGFGALANTGTGTDNTAVGSQTLLFNTSGGSNIAVGQYTLNTNTTGSFNIAIGYTADVNASNYVHTTVIGDGALGTASNQVRIGNPGITSIGGYANWSNISDGRFKKNVKENVPGLEFIKQLRPVTYNLDVSGINKFLRPSSPKDQTGKTIVSSSEDDAAVAQKEKMVHTGFIAQEVETVAKKMNYEFSGIDAAKNDKDLYSLRYSDFVVPLVKAVQELSNTNDSLKTVIDTIQSQLVAIQQQLNSLKSGNTPVISLGETPLLKQNFPNPFNNNTVISYYIPGNASNAQIVIMDEAGRNLKNIVLGSNKGVGQIIIAAGTLASGNYTYSLLVDGKRIDTKQMALLK